MADPSVKQEVKPEDGVSPRPIDDYDLYEDGDGAGDLEFFDQHDEARMYMVRLPKALWKVWSKVDDDEEITLGVVRSWTEPNGKTRMKMLLDSKIPQHQGVPREYNLDITGMNVENLFVFSEQDMPGYKARSKTRSDAISAGIPLSVLKPKPEKVEKPKYEKGKREPYYRKAIPKKTRLAGKIAYELSCAPLHVEEQSHLLRQQIEEVERTRKLQIVDRRAGQKLQAGSKLASEWDNNFIKSQPKPTKQKKMEQKTTRMPKNELMDLLFQCYGRFAYWPLRALKAEVRQPEAWLRQILEDIAVLQKTGTFANTWALKKEYEHFIKNKPAENAAPDAIESDSEDGAQFEDVV